MLAILSSLNAHSFPIFQPILMILLSKLMFHRALSDKTYLSLELPSPLNRFKSSNIYFLLTVPRRCFFWGSFMLFLSCFVMLECTSVCWCFVVICWGRDDLLVLVCDVLLWRCNFPIGILGQVWYLIVSIPDLCLFLTLKLPVCIHTSWQISLEKKVNRTCTSVPLQQMTNLSYTIHLMPL